MMLCEPDDDVMRNHKRLGIPILFLTELWVPHHARGKGHAHSLLTAATEWADSAQTDLWLYTSPFGERPRLEHKELATLYRRYGFRHQRSVVTADYEMVRRYAR